MDWGIVRGMAVKVGQKRVGEELDHSAKKTKIETPEEKLWRNSREKALKGTLLPLEPRKAVPLQLDAFKAEEKGLREFMEDAHFICEMENGKLMAIFDGHGDKGALAQKTADYFKAKLPQLLEPKPSDMKKVFKESFIEYQESLPVKGGGTTAIMVYFHAPSNNLYVANLGDSELKVFRKIEGKIYAIPVSIKRNWSSAKDEKRALEAMDSPKMKNEWLKQEAKYRRFPPKIGVNVSRTFGDKKMVYEGKSALSCHPSVSVVQLKKGDLPFMFCDGVGDFIEDEELIEKIVAPNWDHPETIPQNVANYVLTKKNGYDNITVICAVAVPPHPESPLDATIPYDDNSQETQ